MVQYAAQSKATLSNTLTMQSNACYKRKPPSHTYSQKAKYKEALKQACACDVYLMWHVSRCASIVPVRVLRRRRLKRRSRCSETRGRRRRRGEGPPQSASPPSRALRVVIRCGEQIRSKWKLPIPSIPYNNAMQFSESEK